MDFERSWYPAIQAGHDRLTAAVSDSRRLPTDARPDPGSTPRGHPGRWPRQRFRGDRQTAISAPSEGTYTRSTNSEHDLPSGVALRQITDGLGGLVQRVGPVDERCEPAGLDERLQSQEILLALLEHEAQQLLPGE